MLNICVNSVCHKIFICYISITDCLIMQGLKRESVSHSVVSNSLWLHDLSMEFSRQGLKGGPKTNMKTMWFLCMCIYICIYIYIYKIPPPSGKKNPDLSPLTNGIWFLFIFWKISFAAWAIVSLERVMLFFFFQLVTRAWRVGQDSNEWVMKILNVICLALWCF